MNIKERISHESNFAKGDGKRPIRFVVLHFTANDGDTAAGNANYFASPNRKASAHYFVDEKEAYKTVRNGDVAWHCGAKTYKHPECRNTNSIGIEMCSRKDASGRYYIKPETVANAVELTKQIMQAYGIPVERVLRHYDVTGKSCPEPWVRDPNQWESFKKALTA